MKEFCYEQNYDIIYLCWALVKTKGGIFLYILFTYYILS